MVAGRGVGQVLGTVGGGSVAIQVAYQELQCQTDRLPSGVFIDADLIGDRAERGSSAVSPRRRRRHH